MGGADFNSLEDYISALTTKDPNKLKVYMEGYDGHSLRAFSYWPHRFPFDEITPELSFAIKDDPLLDAIRSRSKNPTFALTYQGTWITLVKNLGFSEAEAKAIEANYHELYTVSDAYVQSRLDQAAIDGYVEVAFGLRLRTPLLKAAGRSTGYRFKEAEAEGRTAGNALGQSYGLLNNRAFNEFMGRVWRSEYRNDVLPIALIHDAIYLIMRDDINVVAWVNENLVDCMSWQDLPELHHDTVKIGAELDLFWPSWADTIGLPVKASKEEIRKKCQEAVSKHVEELAA
jgi:DNA polymerase-1